MILCETLKDDPYDAKADIWSLGVTVIEFAQMEPPNHEMHPMRVLIKIQKADPPSLASPRRWSRDLNQFLGKCLQKNPEMRSTAAELLEVDATTINNLNVCSAGTDGYFFMLQHSFFRKMDGNRPILELVGEAKAEVQVQEEEIDETEIKVLACNQLTVSHHSLAETCLCLVL